jgi:hypothetical protein
VIACILPDKDLIGWAINSSNCPEPFEIELVCGNDVVARSDLTSQLAVTGAAGSCLRYDTMEVPKVLTGFGQDPNAAIGTYIPAQGCSTLSTEAPLEECVDTAKSGGITILIER